VDDKYEYTLDNKDNIVHGWISSNHPNRMGFWVITPMEVHWVFFGTHYIGWPLAMDMDNRKMDPRRTPFIDVTNLTNGKNHDGLRHEECTFQILDVSPRPSGTHKDLASSPSAMPAQKVILIDLTASPNASDLGNRHDVDESQYGSLPEGQMQSHCSGYQFWTRATSTGCFTIGNVPPGVYNLYFLGDYMHKSSVTRNARFVLVSSVKVNPQRNGSLRMS
ncbi:hypothetical protein EJB05_53804, partial [Eragrostis curvula]